MPSIKQSINRAHKQIVEWAYENDLPEVCIVEDDIRFSAKGAWRYYIERKPLQYDLYLGMVYLGDVVDGKVKDFTGLTLYHIHRKFYEKFLSVPDDDHLDRLLDGLGDYHVCDPFVCDQYPGFSSNTGKEEVYDDLLRGRNFFGR